MVNSPCIRSCCLNEEEVCLGCFRSLEEILQWSKAPQPRQHEIIEQAARRKAEHARKYGL